MTGELTERAQIAGQAGSSAPAGRHNSMPARKHLHETRLHPGKPPSAGAARSSSMRWAVRECRGEAVELEGPAAMEAHRSQFPW